ncbi:M43 family zinc metalloprotease [Chryseobacterium cheonjiense]|uniref:T9SS type A sorting domain-containing protein n=1 Tax=Chryseobacterium cheonjiense TaxID=2728845 RepID=A0A7Y0A8S9_9FLAO|nr:M43 family zinc metalloprotease [Chryseobacterium cheonjiense]NML58761.1 T9SS type A sorting domain-containing protein [Chryseobacterium cheonjiense]
MQKSKSFKAVLLLSSMCITLVNAQNKNDKKKAEFVSTKSPSELVNSHGFERCSTEEYEKYLQEKNPKRMTKEQFESWLAPLIKNAKVEKSQNGNIITIPVVVHVIHNGQNVGVGPNIVDEQVMSQITVMNNDYRRLASTPGFNSNPVGADTQIQFALAKVDPNGNPTNGIDRVNLCQASWSQAQIETFVKPETIWDPTQYMNMWSVNFPNTSSILGYAQFPDSNLPGLDPIGGEAYTDGVVARYSTFGSSDYDTNNTFNLDAPYDKGRTMTHEVGHFLGLRHIWGDDTCGTDYCDDTPTAHHENYNCPQGIVSCNDLSLYEMVQNYMDYTDDTCMNIFTINQKDRLRTVMDNSPRRIELKTSTKDVAIALFPNDAEVKLERECTTVNCSSTTQNPKISLYNRGTSPMTSAVITYTVNGNTQTYNWSGNLAPNKYVVISLPISATALGGRMNINVTSVNGVADQRTSNSNIIVNYLGAPTRVDLNVVFKLQLDPYGSETSWTLKNSAGTTVYSSPAGGYGNSAGLPALITQNWTLNPNECYTFTINDTYGDGIYQFGGNYSITSQSGAILLTGSHYSTTQSRTLKAQVLATNDVTGPANGIQIYPNPVSDILNVTKVSDKTSYKIYSAAGQLVRQGNINSGKINVSELIKGGYVITIEEKGKDVFTSKFIKK